MKKSFVFLLLALAVLVLVSPRIVGYLAERSMDRNLEWAATESEELAITSLGFDRGWFSSEGQHRVEVRSGELRDALLALAGDAGSGELPELIIDTHIDHGLVPVSSMGREKGSLAPGLGNAVSTLSLDFGNGEKIRLPGTIYSKVGLTGALTSNLVVEPGTLEVDNETAHWGDADIVLVSSPSSGDLKFRGTVAELALVSASNELAFAGVAFEGERRDTPFGFGVGDAELTIESISYPSEAGIAESGPLRFTTRASLDDDRVSARTTIDVAGVPVGEIGPSNIAIDVIVEDVDAAAAGRIGRALEDYGFYGSGDALMIAVQDDLQTVLATGFRLRVDRLDLTASPGTITASLDVELAPTDTDRFVMTSVLLSLDADLDLSVTKEFYDFLVDLDPDAGSIAAAGFLVPDGNRYEMKAEFSKGRLTINGAPMPVPLPGGN